MPRNTTTITLADELDRLDARLDALAAEVGELESDLDTVIEEMATGDAAGYGDAVEEAIRIQESFLPGVNYLVEEYGDEATVTVGGLTAGDRGRVQDRTAAAKAQRVGWSAGGGGGSTAGLWSIFYVAAGVVDAPFVDGDGGFEAHVRAVREQPPQVVDWLENRVDARTGLEYDLGNSFADRVAVATASDDESG